MCACVRHGCVGEWVGRVGIVAVCVCVSCVDNEGFTCASRCQTVQSV